MGLDDAQSQFPLDRAVLWSQTYNGYARLARTPAALESVLEPARSAFSRSGAVPPWCGVDLLRGWAFYLVRSDRHSGGYDLAEPGSQMHVEWTAVLTALESHPDTKQADRPPTSTAASGPYAWHPRTHRDPDVLAAKQARWWEPHVAPINDLVQRIIEDGNGEVPFVDPDSGGVDARVLLLLEAPARAAAHGSGMLSADNDDATAAHVWEAYHLSGLPREWAVHWNAVPWYVGKKEKIRAVTAAEVEQGRRWLLELLDLTPNLRVVLAMGRAAQRAASPVHDLLKSRGIAMEHCPHPSPRNYNSRPHTRGEVLEAFAKVRRLAT